MIDSNTGISCGACGYRNRSGANLCNLCGGYLYARVANEPPPRSGTGPLKPEEVASAGPAPSLPRRPALVLAPPEAIPLTSGLDAPPPALPVESPARPVTGRDIYAVATKPPVPPLAIAGEREPEDERPARTLPTVEAPSFPHSEPEPPSDLLLERLRAERAVRRAWRAVGIAFGAAVILGLPGSLQPVSLLLCAVGAVLYGFPVGYFASRRSLGVVRGGALGAVAGALFGVALALLFVLVLPATSFRWSALLFEGALSGLLPGAWSGRRER